MRAGRNENAIPSGRSSVLLWLAPAVAWHGLGLALFVNWAEVVDNPPFHYTDYSTHYAAVDTARHFFSRNQMWGYSPYFHAGFPAGAISDVDNKAVEVASYVLHRGGWSLPHAYNAVVLSLLAVAPFGVLAAARRLGSSPAAAGVAQLLMLGVWYGDRAASWMWQGSIISFAAMALTSLWVGASFWGWARSEAPGWADALPWFAFGPLLFWVHVEAVVMLAVLFGVGVAVFGRAWTWRRWTMIAIWALLVLLVNWPWLGVMLRFLDTRISTDLLQGGLGQLRHDLWTPYASLRVAVLASACAGLWAWRREGHRYWSVVGGSLALFLGLAYAGRYVGAGMVQPYRFVIVALALGALPAADWLVKLGHGSPRRAGVVALGVCLAFGPALYLARPRQHRQSDGTLNDHLSGPRPEEKAVCSALRELPLSSGRVLVNDWRLGAWLPACSGAQVIGGPFAPTWTIFEYANANLNTMFGQTVATLGPEEVADLLERYNVRWIVLNTGYGGTYHLADWYRDRGVLLAPLAEHRPFELLRVDRPASWFVRGSGEVEATYNLIQVRGASPGGVVLKYHWLDSLRTEPALPLRPVHVGADPAPFIAVDNGEVADFAIVQSYGAVAPSPRADAG